MLNAIGLDFYVGIVAAVWFAVIGIKKMRPETLSGRRTVPTPRWQAVARIVRGTVEFICALGIAALAVASVIVVSIPPVGVYIGLLLAILALWTIIEAIIPEFRPAPLVVGVISFVVALFYAGFRSDLGAFTVLAFF